MVRYLVAGVDSSEGHRAAQVADVLIEFVIVMARRRVTGFVNYLASLPLEIFEEVMRHVLGVFTRRIGEHWHSRYLDDFYHNASVTLGLDPWHKTNIGLGIS